MDKKNKKTKNQYKPNFNNYQMPKNPYAYRNQNFNNYHMQKYNFSRTQID